jgi:ATP-dependent RNA helicase DeaD
VQTAVLAPEALGRDLLVSAQTGSGKTIAFGLAIASTLLGDAEKLPPAGMPLALIIAPTRELALQVHRELSWLYQQAGARIVACVGGMDPRMEKRELASGCHIVVGTPGRLRDHLERHNLQTMDVKAVVLDEADEMLDLGFREDLEFLLEATPQERRTLLFSATLPRGIVALAQNYQQDALRIAATSGERGHADIEYRAMRISPQDTEHAVVNVLRYFESPTAIVFCNKRETVRHLNAILLERGFSVVSLSGELGQNERNQALQALRDGKARVCVATDVAARGIDLPTLGLVIHADLPNDPESMQHRSGRTGRAGRKGTSVLLIPPSRRRKAEQLLGQARIKAVWCGVPTADDIRKLDNQRLMASLQDAVATTEVEQAEDLAMAQQLLSERSAEEIATALVRIYRSRLPAAEDVIEVSGASNAPRNDFKDGRGRDKGDRNFEKAERNFDRNSNFASPQNTVWFTINLGREKKADPKYLIPEICRQGDITKRHIGVIRILDHETKFEVDEAVASKFAELVRQSTKGLRIEPSDAPDPSERSRAPHKPAHQDKPYRDHRGKSGHHKGGYNKGHRDNHAPVDERPPYNKPSVEAPTVHRADTNGSDVETERRIDKSQWTKKKNKGFGSGKLPPDKNEKYKPKKKVWGGLHSKSRTKNR